MMSEERLAEIEAARYEVETDTFGGYRGMALSDIGYWRSEDDSDELIAEVRQLQADLTAEVECNVDLRLRLAHAREERDEALARVKELEADKAEEKL